MVLTSPWRGSAASAPGGACRVEFQLGTQRLEVDAADASEVAFENAAPVRSFPAWPRKRHYSGLLWLARLHRHIEFESLTERSCLMELDRDPAVTSVASQPMWIRWRDGAPREHAPDYFVRLRGGGVVVIDVRPLNRIDDDAIRQFDRTAVFCTERGWEYEVYSPEAPVRDANLRFLLRYRDPRWRHTEVAARAHGFRGSLQSLAELLDHGDRAESLARCYALIWSGEVTADLEHPLSLRTEVQWKGVA